jgi:Tol biopolymer transport system component
MKHLFVIACCCLLAADARAQKSVPLPDSGRVYSLDSSLVAFVRSTPHKLILTGTDSTEATELWVAHRDGSAARRLVGGQASADMRFVLAGITSPAFSPDGRSLYFLSAAWVTSAAVHAVDIKTGRTRYIAPGNGLEVIPRGNYAGCLLVPQLRHLIADGSYDWVWLLRADGKEIGPVVDDGDDAESRLAKWRKENIPAAGAANSVGRICAGTT